MRRSQIGPTFTTARPGLTRTPRPAPPLSATTGLLIGPRRVRSRRAFKADRQSRFAVAAVAAPWRD